MVRSRSPRRLAAGAALVAMMLAVSGSACEGGVPTGAPTADPSASGLPPIAAAPPDPGAAGRAADAAAARVSSRPTELHIGPDDGFVQLKVISSLGWHYVPYERTYRGLPVIGGDFVVVVDATGQVTSTSVAQTYAIDGVGTEPEVTLEVAQKASSALMKSVSSFGEGRLVVYARGAIPRLAWEFTVNGTGPNGDSRLTVRVDTLSGEVLDSVEGVWNDVGTGTYNGPSPLPITGYRWEQPGTGGQPGKPTPKGPYVYEMKDPQTGLACSNYATKLIFRGDDAVWGNGNLADLETQCVDALFAAETNLKMLVTWLGRYGMDGNGRSVPLYVGRMGDQAWYYPGGIELGYAPPNRPYTSLDIVGHEMGHGIDQHTPGGFSRDGTSEFVADVFGAATEWYANQSAPFDTPDWALGEATKVQDETDLNLEAFRWMDFPQIPFAATCYYPGVASRSAHEAAGVGDRWFYLLADAANSRTGTASLCGVGELTGIGFVKALQIFYHAMLMKTSASSYPGYRAWTVTAAYNLFKDNCITVDKVKAAWDGVSVPAQPNEPPCIWSPNVGGDPLRK